MITTQINNKRVLGLWLFVMPSKLLAISSEEKKWVQKLTPNRGLIYHFSRGCLRHVMSNITGSDPLDIPLKADPGEPPLLAEGWGNISMSHCSDALLIGWSPGKIGVDIERKDRQFQAYKLSKRFFTQYENCEIENLTPIQAKQLVLKRWVIKEAAVKWQRGKIANNINQWIWKNKSSFAYHKKLGHKVKVYEQIHDQWIYAIALDEDSLIVKPIICLN
jgi:phosphopantetheinyl transferase